MAAVSVTCAADIAIAETFFFGDTRGSSRVLANNDFPYGIAGASLFASKRPFSPLLIHMVFQTFMNWLLSHMKLLVVNPYDKKIKKWPPVVQSARASSINQYYHFTGKCG
jgi:hypothetical protein